MLLGSFVEHYDVNVEDVDEEDVDDEDEDDEDEDDVPDSPGGWSGTTYRSSNVSSALHTSPPYKSPFPSPGWTLTQSTSDSNRIVFPPRRPKSSRFSRK